MHKVELAPHEQIFLILLGSWQARALAVATELGLADLFGRGTTACCRTCGSNQRERFGTLSAPSCSRKRRDFFASIGRFFL